MLHEARGSWKNCKGQQRDHEPLGEVPGAMETGYPATQTISQREMLEKAGILHVKPGDQCALLDTQSGTKIKGGVGFPTSAKQRESQKEPHHLGRNRSMWKTNTITFPNGSYRIKGSKSSVLFHNLDNCMGRSDLQCSALKIQQVLILDLLMTQAFSYPIHLWQSDAAFSHAVTYLYFQIYFIYIFSAFSQCTAWQRGTRAESQVISFCCSHRETPFLSLPHVPSFSLAKPPKP